MKNNKNKSAVWRAALAALLGMALFFACNGEGHGKGSREAGKMPLAEYKEDAKANLTAYVEALEPGDYSDENWAAIESIANTGKKNIGTAADKQGVDSALAAAKDEIGLIDKEQKEINELAEYKENAKANLTAYIEALDANDYSGENWSAIEEIANTGKENIDTAADKQGVDSALAAAKNEIGLICIKQKEADELAEYKEDAKANLTAYVESLEQDGYSEENWALLQAAFITGKTAIDEAANKTEVDAALNAAVLEIHLVDYEGRDFVLSISVEETRVKYGEDFVADIRLINKSGEDVEIAFGYTNEPHFSGAIWLFWPHIEGYGFFSIPYDAEPGKANFLTIINNGYDSTEFVIGRLGMPMISNPLAKGNHKLKFRAIFSLNWGAENRQEIKIWSNTVMITVQ